MIKKTPPTLKSSFAYLKLISLNLGAKFLRLVLNNNTVAIICIKRGIPANTKTNLIREASVYLVRPKIRIKLNKDPIKLINEDLAGL